jgi:hypothetical protein
MATKDSLGRICLSSPPSDAPLTPSPPPQAARWVAVKDASASNIMSIVAEYMLAQRVKKVRALVSRSRTRALLMHLALTPALWRVRQ